MVVVWIGLLAIGIVGAALASRRAVTSALHVTEALDVSAAFVGMTVMAIGTDLPEIANSIVASVSDHGDVNVGDSIGSTLTQVTLVLGLLLIAVGPLDVDRRFVLSVGAWTVGAVLTGAALYADGVFSRGDGLVLVSLWVLGTALVGHTRTPPRPPAALRRSVYADSVRAIGWLGVVGASATIVVRAFIEITDIFGVPEYLASMVVLALGTSLPELVVDWTAIRRGATALAVGDLFGSSFVDATLSIGIGPVIAATAVSADATRGSIIAALAVMTAVLLVTRTRRHGRATGVALVVTYLAAYTILLT